MSTLTTSGVSSDREIKVEIGLKLKDENGGFLKNEKGEDRIFDLYISSKHFAQGAGDIREGTANCEAIKKIVEETLRAYKDHVPTLSMDDIAKKIRFVKESGSSNKISVGDTTTAASTVKLDTQAQTALHEDQLGVGKGIWGSSGPAPQSASDSIDAISKLALGRMATLSGLSHSPGTTLDNHGRTRPAFGRDLEPPPAGPSFGSDLGSPMHGSLGPRKAYGHDLDPDLGPDLEYEWPKRTSSPAIVTRDLDLEREPTPLGDSPKARHEFGSDLEVGSPVHSAHPSTRKALGSDLEDLDSPRPLAHDSEVAPSSLPKLEATPARSLVSETGGFNPQLPGNKSLKGVTIEQLLPPETFQRGKGPTGWPTHDKVDAAYRRAESHLSALGNEFQGKGVADEDAHEFWQFLKARLQVKSDELAKAGRHHEKASLFIHMLNAFNNPELAMTNQANYRFYLDKVRAAFS